MWLQISGQRQKNCFIVWTDRVQNRNIGDLSSGAGNLPAGEGTAGEDQQSACHAGERIGAETKRTCIRRKSAF